ncbi:hypothetical protein [Nocardia sp. CC227C]|uniref:YunG family protein n=1 Tax=Nocardia sp. CC227C TaxID=3044562 RepID=UPI00278BC9A8|nr:hypothetical protein [Nocardia sp. CC227C]
MGSVTIDALRRALKQAWSAETSASSDWTDLNRAKGQCAVTACVVQDYLGGDILHSMATLPSGKQVSHYVNLIEEALVDLTREQFPEVTEFSSPQPKTKGYSSTREYCLSFDATRTRYELLAERVARQVAGTD